MAFQPKIFVLTLVGILLFYNLILISINSYSKCKEETEELFKKKKFWIPLSVGVLFLFMSFTMTSKYAKSRMRALTASRATI
mgnify:CR=1 FL=1|jgi:choline-glycine betaine transporter